jgi:hypothetical protein
MGPDDAFELLRRRSNDANVPVRELARRLVAGVVDGSVTGTGLVDDAARRRIDRLLEGADGAGDEAPQAAFD